MMNTKTENNGVAGKDIDYSEMAEFKNMSRKEKVEFIFKLHNAEFIQDKLKGYIQDCTFTHTPTFDSIFEFNSKNNEVLKFNMSGDIIESPVSLADLGELYPINIARDELLTFAELTESKLKRTSEMIDLVF